MNPTPKPYRKSTGRNPEGTPYDYKDLSKVTLSEEQLASVVNTTSINNIFSGGSGGVLDTRRIDTTLPLTGGGDLSADRTLDVNDATTSAVGVVELATDGEAAASVVVQGNDSRLVRRLGAFYYGDGADGALSLGSDTTLSSGDNIKRYTDLTLNGFTLQNHSADDFLIIYVSGTLSLGGGKIRTVSTSGGAAGTPGAVGGGTGGTGGAGGNASGALFVFAKTIIGTGSIQSSGDGANGTAGLGGNVGGGNSGGGNGGTPTAAGFTYGQSLTFPFNAAGGTNITGGTGGGAYSATNIFRNYKLLQNWLYIDGDVTSAVASPWRCRTQAGGGGGGGDVSNLSGAPAFGSHGGGGGGGGSSYGAGSAGGTGSIGVYSGLPGGNSSTAGGGGGGGAGGGVVVVISDTAPSTLTVSAKGGNGGAGAIGANTFDGSIAGSGGGGGGGGGGLAILVAQAGNGVTVTAAGGTGGAGGPATGGGTAGAAGTNGVTGIAMPLVL